MEIEWTIPALEDLESIRDFISRDSTLYANAFIQKIFDAAERFGIFPMTGRKVPEADSEFIREWLFQGYRIIHHVQAEAGHIRVLAVAHGSRDLANLEHKPWEIH